MDIYNAKIRSKLTLKDTEYNKCACDVCTKREFVDDYDILSSTLHPNVKAGFARYRDRKETKASVADLKLSPAEMQRVVDGLSDYQRTGEKLDILSTIMVHCKTVLFSGNIDFMKNVLTSSEDHNTYDPFGIPHYKDVLKDGKKGPIKGYKMVDKSIECCYCGKVTDTSSEDFICLRIMDVESRQTKNSCCVDLKKYGYSIVSYVWTDVDEVCDKIGEEYYGIDGKPLINAMQKLLNHVITPTCKYVWIDQFCIDQENISDKELSVTHMDKTYSYSDMCVICARKSTVKSLIFLEMLKETNVDLSTLSNFNGNMDARILAFLDYSVILSFVVDPWFSRGWTLQESILPRKLAVAVEGVGLIDLDWTLKHSSVWIGRMSNDTRYVAELFSIPNSNNYICSMVVSLTSQLDAIFNGRSRPMDWSTVAKIMSSRQTTVELDQVFCLRGILPKSQNIPVDYSADMELTMKKLSDLYPESRSSLYYNVWACEHPALWSQYRCLPPLLPIENPTTEQTCVGECTFVDISNEHVDGSIIRACIEMGRNNGLDINHVLGDATYGILEIFYPGYIDENITKVDKDERGEVSGRASHMFLQLELYSRTWMTGTMMVTPDNRALLAFTMWNPPYNTPTKLWMGDKRCFESAKYAVPLFTADGKYIGWCFCG
jgi:hypothetical protein